MMYPNCESCWNPIKSHQYTYGDITMCEECYNRTVSSLEDIKNTPLFQNESIWSGTYLLESGDLLRCHDCVQFDELDWDEEDEIIGSVYYEIDELDSETGKYLYNVDGGEMGYTEKSTFGSYCETIMNWHGIEIAQKISDEDYPLDE